jgi:hypothetical protein
MPRQEETTIMGVQSIIDVGPEPKSNEVRERRISPM